MAGTRRSVRAEWWGFCECDITVEGYMDDIEVVNSETV